MPKDTGDVLLECNREACVDIDSGLGIVPATTAAVHKATGLGTTVIRILGVEDIVDLAHEADFGVRHLLLVVKDLEEYL